MLIRKCIVYALLSGPNRKVGLPATVQNCHLKNVKQAVVFQDVCVEDSHCLADAVSPIFNNIHSHIVSCDIGPCPVCWA